MGLACERLKQALCVGLEGVHDRAMILMDHLSSRAAERVEPLAGQRLLPRSIGTGRVSDCCDRLSWCYVAMGEVDSAAVCRARSTSNSGSASTATSPPRRMQVDARLGARVLRGRWTQGGDPGRGKKDPASLQITGLVQAGSLRSAQVRRGSAG